MVVADVIVDFECVCVCVVVVVDCVVIINCFWC